MVTRSKVENESSCCIQDTLKWFSGYIAAGRLAQSYCSQPKKYERRKQLSCDFLTDETCNLM